MCHTAWEALKMLKEQMQYQCLACSKTRSYLSPLWPLSQKTWDFDSCKKSVFPTWVLCYAQDMISCPANGQMSQAAGVMEACQIHCTLHFFRIQWEEFLKHPFSLSRAFERMLYKGNSTCRSRLVCAQRTMQRLCSLSGSVKRIHYRSTVLVSWVSVSYCDHMC